MDIEFMTTQDIEILNAIGVIYCEEMMLESACEYFKKGIQIYSRIPDRLNSTVLIKIQYNFAVTLTRLEKYTDSISTCLKGIDFCLENKSFYLLGQLYHVGYNYSLLLEIQKAEQYYKIALNIFEFQNQKFFIDHIRGKIKDLSVANN